MLKNFSLTRWSNVVNIFSSKRIKTGIEINDIKCQMKKVKLSQSAKTVKSTVSPKIKLVCLLKKIRRQL